MKKFTITADEAKALNDANAISKDKLTEAWRTIAIKYAIVLNTIKSLGGLNFEAQPMIAVAPPVPVVTAPTPVLTPTVEIIMPDELPIIYPGSTEFTEVALLSKFQAVLEQRDKLVDLLANIQVTDHNSNAIARELGVKAKRFTNSVDEIIDRMKRPALDTQKNFITIGKKINEPLLSSLNYVSGMVSAFEKKIQAENDKQALLLKQEQEQLDKGERDKQAKSLATRQWIEKFQTEQANEVKNAKDKKALNKIVEYLESYQPSTETLGDQYDYFMKVVSELVQSAKKGTQGTLAIDDDLETRKQEREEHNKNDLKAFLEVMGIKPGAMDDELQKYFIRFGTWEIAYDSRHTIRTEIEKATALKSQAVSTETVKVKNRRKVVAFKIVDATLVPAEYRSIDEKLIKLAMKMNKVQIEEGKFNIPGIEWEEDTKTVFRG